jgi:hypothetical protein
MHPGNPSSSAAVLPYNMSPMLGIPTHGGQLVIREPQTQHQHHQQQIFEAQQLAAAVAAREQQEILRTYEQQQQQQPELVRFNGGFDPALRGGSVTASGFNQMNVGGGVMSPSLALGNFENPCQMQPPQQGEHHGHPLHHALQAQLLLQPVQQGEQTQQAQSELKRGA